MDQQGPSCSLAEFIREHDRLLYRLAYRLTGSPSDAEDLTQQTFLLAQKNMNQLRDPKCARAWLCTILRNCYRKSVRRRRGVAFVSLDDVAEPPQEQPRETPLEWHDVETALNELPDEFRVPLILFYFNAFSYKEIAAHLAVPIGTVMSRLARGKSYLRRSLLGSRPEPTVTAANSDMVRLFSP